jgi:hypothetical protein
VPRIDDRADEETDDRAVTVLLTEATARADRAEIRADEANRRADEALALVDRLTVALADSEKPSGRNRDCR